jgi:hypothetical protein
VTTLSATVVATIPELASNQPRAEYAVSLWAHNVQWLVDRGHPANRVIQTEVVDRGLVSTVARRCSLTAGHGPRDRKVSGT